jgi:hypothetical protein
VEHKSFKEVSCPFIYVTTPVLQALQGPKVVIRASLCGLTVAYMICF